MMAPHHTSRSVSPTLPLVEALAPLDRKGCVFIGDGDTIIGVLTADQLATFAELRHVHP